MKTTFTLLFLCLSLSTFAQRNFVPGYYITLDGQKIEAQIDDRNWDRSPDFIEISENGQVSKLHVSSISGFALSSGDVFDAFVVDVDKTSTTLNEIRVGQQPAIVSDTVFLRALVKGAASLYYLRDENSKEHYYIRKGGEIPLELINRTIKVQNGSQIAVTKSQLYKGLLKVYLTECPEVAGRAESLAFKRKPLMEFVVDYNTCVTGSGHEYAATVEKIKFSWSAVAGISYNNLAFSSSTHEQLEQSEFSNTSPTFGVSILATLPRANGRWGLQAELMYKNVGGEDSYTEVGTSSQTYVTYDTKFNMGLLGINAALRYRLLDNSLKPFVKVGIGNNIVISDDNQQEVTTRFYTTYRNKNQEPFQSLRKLEQALILGAGIEFSSFTAEGNFEYGNGFSDITTLRNRRSSYILKVGYRIF